MLRLVLEGLSNQDIADRLGIQTVTVEKHLKSCFVRAGLTGTSGSKRSKLVSFLFSKFGEARRA